MRDQSSEKLRSYIDEFEKRQFKHEYDRFMKTLSASDKILFQVEVGNKKEFDDAMNEVAKEETLKLRNSWRLLLVPKTAYYDADQYEPYVSLDEQIEHGKKMKRRALNWKIWRDWLYWGERLVLIVLGGIGALMLKPVFLAVMEFLKGVL